MEHIFSSKCMGRLEGTKSYHRVQFDLAIPMKKTEVRETASCKRYGRWNTGACQRYAKNRDLMCKSK